MIRIKLGETYSPKELKLPFPEVKSITVGKCVVEKYPYEVVLPSGTILSVPNMPIGPFGGAHTHHLKQDSNYKSICVIGPYALQTMKDQSRNLLWHEYGHVLCDGEVVEDAGTFLIHWTCDCEIHGPKWQEIMQQLGKPHLNSGYVPLDIYDASGGLAEFGKAPVLKTGDT